MVFQYYSTNAEAGALYDLADVMCVKLKWDSHLVTHNWDYVWVGMRNKPTEETLSLLFLENLRGCCVMWEEVDHYDRARKGAVDKSYQYLPDCV